MAKILKQGMSQDRAQETDTKVRNTVENILKDIEQRGDAAVRELSERFDKWSPANFRLSQAQIEDLIATLPEQVITDIQFAQAQVRHFAEARARRSEGHRD